MQSEYMIYVKFIITNFLSENIFLMHCIKSGFSRLLAYLDGGVGGCDLITKNTGTNIINPAIPSDITNYSNNFIP